jgi:hypothetical protein
MSYYTTSSKTTIGEGEKLRRKDLLLTLIVAFIITTPAIINLPSTVAQGTAAIAVSPTVIDTRNLKQVGDTFSINITVANVAQLWGYQYSLFYNTSVINATNYVGLDARFTTDLPSEIGIDYIAVSRKTYDGDTTGITTTTPIPVDRIDFIVTGNGTTTLWLDPNYCALADIHGLKIVNVNVNGKFSNTEQLTVHDIGITDATLSATSGKPGDTITITATIANLGDFTENVTVRAKFNRTETNIVQIGTAQNIPDLAQDGNEQVTITWDTAGVPDGKYQVTVEANVTVDDNIADNTHSTIVTLSSGSGGIPMQYIYIGVGVAVVAIAAIAVYALRARKP